MPIKLNKILVVHPFDAFGGSQRVTLGSIHSFETEFDVVKSLVVFGGNGFLTQSKDCLVLLNISSSFVRKILYVISIPLISLIILYFALRRYKIYAATYYSAPYLFFTALVYPAKCILHLHEIEVPNLIKFYVDLLARSKITLLFVSGFHRNKVKLPGKIVLNYVDYADHIQPTYINPCVAKIIFVGSPTVHKGFDLFSAATALLPSTKTSIVAYVGSSSVLTARNQATHIQFVTGISDVAEIYDSNSILLLCTDPKKVSETFSLAAAEAMSNGTLVANLGSEVASELFGKHLIINDSSRNPETISKKVLHIIDNFDDYSEHRASAKEFIRTKYNFDKYTRNLLDAIG